MTRIVTIAAAWFRRSLLAAFTVEFSVMQDCLFCRMAAGTVAVERLAENDHAFAIRDINPRAPVHDLIIPREHVDNAREIEWVHGELLAGLFALSGQVARLEGV